MGREDLINHIDREMRRETNRSSQTDETAVFCQHCGTQIADGNTDTQTTLTSDYIVHRIPEHGGQKIKSVFYCGRSCFNEAMSDLLSV